MNVNPHTMKLVGKILIAVVFCIAFPHLGPAVLLFIAAYKCLTGKWKT